MKNKERKFRRVFFDIETSPSLATVWRTGRQVVTHKQILEENKIICICWKVEGESKVRELHWDSKQEDKKMIEEFAKVVQDADEIVAHNGDRFDIKTFRTRCLFAGVVIPPEISTVDTYKFSRLFNFTSHKLDWLGEVLLGEGKMEHEGYDLWKKVKLDNDRKALNKMINYCKKDVVLLEKVYEKLAPYSKPKHHVGVVLNDDRASCGHCGSKELSLSKTRVTAAGIKKRQMQCKGCGRYYTISDAVYKQLLAE